MNTIAEVNDDERVALEERLLVSVEVTDKAANASAKLHHDSNIVELSLRPPFLGHPRPEVPSRINGPHS